MKCKEFKQELNLVNWNNTPIVFSHFEHVYYYAIMLHAKLQVTDSLTCKKVKVHSYIAWYPVFETDQSALHFTPWQTCSFQHHFYFYGKHSAMLQLLREDYFSRYPSLSVARYSFIQLSELWQHGMNEMAKASKHLYLDLDLSCKLSQCFLVYTLLLVLVLKINTSIIIS